MEIVIRVYASEKAYQTALERAIFMQASVDFLLQLAKVFEVQPYCGQRQDSLVALPHALRRYDFHRVENGLKEDDRTAVQLWQTNTRKKSWVTQIRQRLHDGALSGYSLSLVGDVKLISCSSRPLTSIRSPFTWDVGHDSSRLIQSLAIMGLDQPVQLPDGRRHQSVKNGSV